MGIAIVKHINFPPKVTVLVIRFCFNLFIIISALYYLQILHEINHGDYPSLVFRLKTFIAFAKVIKMAM